MDLLRIFVDVFSCVILVGHVAGDVIVLPNVPEWFRRKLDNAYPRNATASHDDDLVVLPNVPDWIWRQLDEMFLRNASDSLKQGLYRLDSHSLENDDAYHESVDVEDNNNLSATIAVWSIASFMILTSLAAIAYFFVSRRRYQKVFQVPDVAKTSKV